MKKSELRNIIRESIYYEDNPSNKGLMNEQGGWPGAPNSRICNITNCQGGQYTINVNTAMVIDGNIPQVGDTFTYCCGPQTAAQGHGMPCSPYGTSRSSGCNTVFQSNAAYNPNHRVNKVWKVVAVAPPGQTWSSTNATIGGWMNNTAGPCGWSNPNWPNNPLGCPPCDPSAWSNLTNWTNNWTNGGPFNSSNTNQPCTHICGKIQQWTNACTAASNIQTNQLACKIAEGQNQASIHGCNC